MAHASRQALVTVERIEDGDFLRDPALAAGTIPALYIRAIAEAENGAWPVGLDNAYPPDAQALGRLRCSCSNGGWLCALGRGDSRTTQVPA